jgi:hypothetical protein
VVAIFGSSILHPIGKTPNQAETNATYGDLESIFGKPGYEGSWIKRETGINDFNEKFVWMVDNTDGESVLLPRTASVHDGIHDQFIDNDAEPVSQPLVQSSLSAILLDGDQQCGVVGFGPGESCFERAIVHSSLQAAEGG